MARHLRILMILVLTLALLPWGAWIKAANAQPLSARPVAQSVLPLAPQARTGLPHCRIATLPGATCPADPALLPVPDRAPDAATRQALRAADVTARALHAPSGPERPPRLT